MARVRVWTTGDEETFKEVRVGDVVGFKSDHEQYGKIVKIVGDRLHLHNPNGFSGDYLRYATDTVECAGDCWSD